MNERIKELANRAMVEREDGWHEFDAYVFAELLIRECIEHLESSVLVPNIEHSRTKTKCVRAIKEHFGVQ
jgi:anaerobic glycerol-3-phosphate dehydrogenase